MFSSAISFKQDLSEWDFCQIIIPYYITNVFSGTEMVDDDYPECSNQLVEI
jgi:hypothetical protein